MQKQNIPTLSAEAYSFLENLYTSIIYVPKGDGEFDLKIRRKHPGSDESVNFHTSERQTADLNAAAFQFVDAMLETSVMWGAIADQIPALQGHDHLGMKCLIVDTAIAFTRKYDADHGTENGEWQKNYEEYYEAMDEFISDRLISYAEETVSTLEYQPDITGDSEDGRILADVAEIFVGLIGSGK